MKVIVTIPFDGSADQHTDTVEGNVGYLKVDPHTGALQIFDRYDKALAVYAPGHWSSVRRED